MALCTQLARLGGAIKFDGLARENLRIAFGDTLPSAKRKEIRIANARAIGRMLAELADYWHHGTATATRLVDTDPTLAHLDRALAAGRGAVVVTPHFGNWELFPSRIVALGYVGAVVARTPSNPYLARELESMRSRAGVETLDSLRSRRRTLEVLHAGGIVGLLPDFDLKRASGIFVPFLGKPAWTATGPAHLAVSAGAPLLTAYVIPEGDRYRLVFEEGILPEPGAEKRAEIERLTRAWSARFEARIRERPELWVWIHRRWDTTPEVAAERRARGRDGGLAV